MARFIKKKTEKVGAPPGTLKYIGRKKEAPIQIDLYRYHADDVETLEDIKPQDAGVHGQPDRYNWLVVQGVHQVEVIQEIGRAFGIDNLILEDILDTSQRPKFEEGNDWVFFLFNRLAYKKEIGEVRAEQVCMWLSGNVLITFLESKLGSLEVVRARLEKPGTRMRQNGSEYMAYAIMDTVEDNYIRILQEFGEQVERLETELLDAPKKEHLERINKYKHDITFMRKAIWPVQEVIHQFIKSELYRQNDYLAPFLADLKDHLQETLDIILIYKDMLANQAATYNAALSNKLNDIMMLLTIYSVIFIPLTFLAGIYGMNFEHMPELSRNWAYPAFWGLEISIALAMIIYFKRRGWL